MKDVNQEYEVLHEEDARTSTRSVFFGDRDKLPVLNVANLPTSAWPRLLQRRKNKRDFVKIERTWFARFRFAEDLSQNWFFEILLI